MSDEEERIRNFLRNIHWDAFSQELTEEQLDEMYQRFLKMERNDSWTQAYLNERWFNYNEGKTKDADEK